MNEFEYEEVRGLPGKLPEGEKILWQGAPNWRALARRVFHLRTLTIYFLVLVVLRGVIAATADEASAIHAMGAALSVVPIALAGLAIVAGLAWWHARTTVYTITNRRVVLRYGIAVQLAINLPFTEMVGASVSVLPGGEGEIPLSLGGTGRLAYLHLWPHARPGFIRNPQPMLRCVPQGSEVAALLTEAWRADRSRLQVTAIDAVDSHDRDEKDTAMRTNGLGHHPVGVPG